MQNVLEYANYKTYLKAAITQRALTTKGVRSRFAEAIQCQPGYVTQVLEGDAELSPDQASLTAQFLGLAESEADYFLLLVLRARAGTPSLRRQLDAQIAKHRAHYLDVKERLKAPRIPPADENIFYANWQYVAILSLIAVPGYQTRETIAARLNLPPTVIAERLEQLKALGLVVQKGAKYTFGPSRTHLPKESPMNARHHQSWRLRAMQSIERESTADFHFTAVVTIAAADRDVIKDLLIKSIEKAAKIVAPSPAEILCGLNLDFFEV